MLAGKSDELWMSSFATLTGHAIIGTKGQRVTMPEIAALI
jgi:hypothetical protein